MNFLKSYLREHINSTYTFTVPVRIFWEIYELPGRANWDLGNLWLWDKAFEDVLVEKGIIVDDSCLYVTQPAAPLFFPVKDEKDRKHVWIVEEDERFEQPYYRSFLDERDETLPGS